MKACLKCAGYQQLKGYKTCQDCYSVLWGVLINNLSADLELTDEQTVGLVRIVDEMNRIIMGAEESGLSIEEYNEYILAKADECTARLRTMCIAKEGSRNETELFRR